eukprot:COSAG01_NODE_25179_length_753_cov_0.949541_2_plen_42_part_01
MQESTTDAEAATDKLSALTAEREFDPMASRDSPMLLLISSSV